MAKREMSKEDQLARRESLQKVQEAFPNTLEGFLLFAQVCVNQLITGNPNLNRIQADICKWLFNGPEYRMVQAQRGQSKTTLTAIYAVFRLIHTPTMRILILSAAGKMSKKIAFFIIQILNSLSFLEILRADQNSGDRASIEGYDIHWLFKGVDASPSVMCMGVDSSIQGSRADLVIPDDIESTKNSKTVVTREQLEDQSKECELVCATGEIIYLGTPQGTESIYNNLVARGYDVRIWPGRYMDEAKEEAYGNNLAPMIKQQMLLDPTLREGGGLDGTRGKPTCPEMFPELRLQKKELSIGAAKFQLQYMLDTSLSDTERYPLKISNLIVAEFNVEQGPVLPIWSSDPRNMYLSAAFGSKYKVFRAVPNQYELRPFEQTIMYIDPAGGGKNGGDETGYAVIKLIGAYVYIIAVGGFPGGYEEEKLVKLVHIAKKYKAKTVVIEENYGKGAHANMLKPLFPREKWPVTIEEEWVTGQKELRIIDVVEPLLTSHRLIISPQALEHDASSVKAYPTAIQVTYRLVHQMAMITRDRGCLRHDDRLDALAGAIRFVVENLDFDTQVVIEAKRRSEALNDMKTWNDPVSRRTWLTGIQEVSPGRKQRRYPARNAFAGKAKSTKRNMFKKF